VTLSLDTFVIAPLPPEPAAETAEILAALHAAAVADEPGGGAWQPAGIARLLAASATFAMLARAVESGEPLGFLLAQSALDEAEILMLAVTPAARRQGVAKRLLNDGHEALALRGVTRVLLDVADDNTAARALYDSAGYQPLTRRRGYYARPDGVPVDAHVLAKSLTH
jgi:[ribosomal protein S18]-alanine N-acetyltransferase